MNNKEFVGQLGGACAPQEHMGMAMREMTVQEMIRDLRTRVTVMLESQAGVSAALDQLEARLDRDQHAAVRRAERDLREAKGEDGLL